ncbi:hypothetical protein BCR44DRAFT_1425729 [Catenaria anguillulae PL171]|uniref:Uncharacterized protein n=1 Tax=Catenaria anguillulae PL171 TaxID=765915 RepID=A0A1Y2HZ01_9FUNG|nr:hypothetical protein BCR44DRAFT_1425729 [Catenaria anguillulae PL171]
MAQSRVSRLSAAQTEPEASPQIATIALPVNQPSRAGHHISLDLTSGHSQPCPIPIPIYT